MGAAAAAGAVIAVAIAVAASPLMPIGPARLAEPGPGASADVTVLGLGAAAMVALLRGAVGLGGVAGWIGSQRGGHCPRWHIGCGGVAGWGRWPVTAATGARFALEPGRGHTAVPVRSALAGTALSVLTVVAAFTFGANLLHLVHTPRLYGQTWDVAAEFGFGGMTQMAERILRATPGVSGWSYGSHAIIGIDRTVVPAIGVAAGRGPLLAPVLLDGHPPRSSHEIVLGTSVLRRIGRRVGQSVTVAISRRHESVRIVGRAVFPTSARAVSPPPTSATAPRPLPHCSPRSEPAARSRRPVPHTTSC